MCRRNVKTIPNEVDKNMGSFEEVQIEAADTEVSESQDE